MTGPIVLVHGAMHGGWCWRRVLPLLRAAGAEVHAPTLTGLGERAHLLTAGTDLQTHVDDVTAVLRTEELTGVTLVGHSYGALVVAGVLDTAADLVDQVVLFDGPVGEHGDSGASLHPAAATFLSRETVVDGIAVLPPSDGSRLGLDPDDLAWVRRRLTPQPVAAVRGRLHLPAGWPPHVRRSYLRTRGADGTASPLPDRARDWTVRTVDGGHDAMIGRPAAVAAVLLELATPALSAASPRGPR
jgi:pimeloyl-ACP methyl ester carboxylesterase